MRASMFETDSRLNEYLIRWDTEVAKPLIEWQRMLSEAKLSPEQINALFGGIETKMTGEKTMVGKGISMAGKGAAVVSKVLPSNIAAKIAELIKDKPKVRNFDAAFDRAKLKLRTAMGGKFNNTIVKYVDWLGRQAKAHPILGGVALGLIIAGTAMATSGLTAGIVAALLKTGMELIKGERLSKSILSGIGTGVLGVLLGLSVRALGEWLNNFEINSETIPGYIDLKKINLIGEMNGVPTININTYMTSVTYEKVNKLMDLASEAFDREDYDRAVEIYHNLNRIMNDSDYLDRITAVANDNQELIKSAREGAVKAAKIFNDIASGIQGVTSTGIRRSKRDMSESMQLREADIKGIATSIFNWAKSSASSKYKEITQKHTVEKLSNAWKQAGSPTDSKVIYALLRDAGIPTDVLSAAYKENNIPVPKKPSKPKTKTKLITVNTGDEELDKTVNGIIATKGKDAAIAYLYDLKSKELAAATTSSDDNQGDEPITVGKEKILPTDPRYPALKNALKQKPKAAASTNPIAEYATGGASVAGGVSSVANPFGFTISRTPNLFGYMPPSAPAKRRKRKRSKHMAR